MKWYYYCATFELKGHLLTKGPFYNNLALSNKNVFAPNHDNNLLCKDETLCIINSKEITITVIIIFITVNKNFQTALFCCTYSSFIEEKDSKANRIDCAKDAEFDLTWRTDATSENRTTDDDDVSGKDVKQ